MDETYVRVKGKDKYLYRAVDKYGQTIDFLLTARRDVRAAKRFFRKALSGPGNPHPRVINVDKNPAYPAAVKALKAEGTLRRRCRLRQCKYLNNVIETTLFRFKTIFGDRVGTRRVENQFKELLLKCAILNQMTHLGMPECVKVTG